MEVNCETDFVARGDVFQTLAADVAMQVASYPQVVSVTKEEFPTEELERERKIAMEMDDLKGKPDNIRRAATSPPDASPLCSKTLPRPLQRRS